MVDIVTQGNQIFRLEGRLNTIGPNMPNRPSWIVSMAFGIPDVFGYQVWSHVK